MPDNADLIRLLAEDAVVLSGSDWPEQAAWEGHEGIRTSMEEWAVVWQSSRVEMGPIERHGDKILGRGTWRMRGAASGAESTMPFAILFGFRGGKIAEHEWFNDYDAARAAARGA